MHGFYNRKMSHQFLCLVLKVSGACIQESQRTVKKKEKKKEKQRERERDSIFKECKSYMLQVPAQRKEFENSLSQN